jgi:nucleotide-binding universal stress UspA family protein
MAAGYEPEMAEIMKEQFQNAQQTLDRAAAALKVADFNAKGRVVEAETRSGILDLASEWHADLIVLGSHGRKGLQRFMWGKRGGIGCAWRVLFRIDCLRHLGDARHVPSQCRI